MTYAKAASAAKAVGIDPTEMLKRGVDAFLRWIGYSDCSGTNKSKYRALVAGRSAEELLRRLESNDYEGTGNCRKYHQAKMAEKVIRAAKRADQARARDEACRTGAGVWTDYGVLVLPPADCKPAFEWQPWMADLAARYKRPQVEFVELSPGLQVIGQNQRQQSEGAGGGAGGAGGAAALALLALPFILRGK